MSFTWNYRIIHHDKDEKPWFGLHEVHYNRGAKKKEEDNDDTVINGYTENTIGLICDVDEGPEGMISSIKMMIADCARAPILKESKIVFVEDELSKEIEEFEKLVDKSPEELKKLGIEDLDDLFKDKEK